MMAHSDRVGIDAGVTAAKAATEATADVTLVRVQTGPCPAHAPVHPVKADPDPGVAVQVVVPPEGTVVGEQLAVPPPLDTVAAAGIVGASSN